MYHYVYSAVTYLSEIAMHTAVIRSPQRLANLDNRMSWHPRLRSMLSIRRHRRNKDPKHDTLRRAGDRPIADVGLHRERAIRHPQNRTDQQQMSLVPVALLAMWMPRI